MKRDPDDWRPELREVLEKMEMRMRTLYMEARIELLRNELKRIQEENHEKG